MPPTLVLVDYDNLRPGYYGERPRPGRRPNFTAHEDVFERLRAELIAHFRTLGGQHEVRMRLYGGWSDASDGRRTEAGDMVASVVHKYRNTNVGKVRVRAELVETLVDDRYRESPLYRTFRQLPWQGARLELRPRPGACTDPAAACAGYEAFRSWAVNGRCPNRSSCQAVAGDCVEQKSQKLIDTMIVADAILGAADGSGVAVVSMDDDLVPGLLAAARYGQPTALIRFGYRNRPGEYDAILEYHGVTVYDYDELG